MIDSSIIFVKYTYGLFFQRCFLDTYYRPGIILVLEQDREQLHGLHILVGGIDKKIVIRRDGEGEEEREEKKQISTNK